MHKLTKIFLIFFISISSLQAMSKEDKVVIDSINTLRNIMALPENSIPPKLFHQAYAVAVIPKTYKAGFLIGGEFGRGVLCVKDDNGIYGNPIFITLGGLSFGFQIGASSNDLVLAFKTKKSIDGLISSKLTLGVDASVAAGDEGRSAAFNSDIFLQSEVYTYSRSKGLYAGLSLEGSVLGVDELANEMYYGAPTSPTDIINNYKINPPRSSEVLRILFNGN